MEKTQTPLEQLQEKVNQVAEDYGEATPILQPAGPVIHRRPEMLQKVQIEVTSEHDMVAIKIGNTTMRLHYEDALTLSIWIQQRAKESKSRMGDMSRHLRALGTLSDSSGG